MNKAYKIVLVLICILLVGTILLGASYAIWQRTYTQEGTNEVNVGCFNVTFTNLESYGGEEAGDINLVNAYPISDSEGSQLTPYVFKIQNTCTVSSSYTIDLETLNTTTFNTDYLRLMFNEASSSNNTTTLYNELNNGVISLTGEANASKILTTGYLAAGEEITYALRVWIDVNATTTTPNVMLKTWNGKVVVSSEATFSQEKTVEGERLTYITDGVNETIKNIEITGNTVNSANVGQDGTLDIVVSGKNLIDYRKIPSKTENGVTFSNNNDGSVTISGSKTDISLGLGDDFAYSSNISKSLFGLADDYYITSYDCQGNDNLYIYPRVYVNAFRDGSYAYSYIVTTSDRKTNRFTESMINASDYRVNIGFWTDSGSEVTPGTYCPQIERGNTNTAFEPYKEHRYTIHLKDASNNTINGLSSSDTLKKLNGTWVIDNGTTQTTLADSTQVELNSMYTYDGISNIWVDDDVLITSIKTTYTASNS